MYWLLLLLLVPFLAFWTLKLVAKEEGETGCLTFFFFLIVSGLVNAVISALLQAQLGLIGTSLVSFVIGTFILMKFCSIPYWKSFVVLAVPNIFAFGVVLAALPAIKELLQNNATGGDAQAANIQKILSQLPGARSQSKPPPAGPQEPQPSRASSQPSRPSFPPMKEPSVPRTTASYPTPPSGPTTTSSQTKSTGAHTATPSPPAPDVDIRDANGWTPLMLAASSGDLISLDVLLNKGANVNLKDPNGWTPLMLASHQGDAEAVRPLLAKRADVSAGTLKNTTALIVAAGGGHLEIVQLLLDAGADPRARDSDGKIALDYATQKGHAAVVELLKNAPAPKPRPSVATPPAPSNPPPAPAASTEKKDGPLIQGKSAGKWISEAQSLADQANAQPRISGEAPAGAADLSEDPKVAVPLLIEQLNNTSLDSDLRMQAAVRLSEFRKDAKAAIPALEKAAKDPDPVVRDMAQMALQKIRMSIQFNVGSPTK